MSSEGLQSCLVDTNVLLRIARSEDLQHGAADASLLQMMSRGIALFYTHQNMAELWNVMTRPANRNGFGLSPSAAQQELERIENHMSLLPDSAASYREWRRLIQQHNVSGIQVHDTRLVATMLTNNVSHILTFNGDDFRRFDGIMVLDPRHLQLS